MVKVTKMAEERVFFNSGKLKIEGLLNHLQGDHGVVVSHPHPLYGGDMQNNVVGVVVNAYFEKGYSTLRFNFRGVGASEGTHDHGVGEQDDVRAAIEFLSNLGIKHVDLAGYSFGAWVNAMGLTNYVQVDQVIMVSPPVGFLDFETLKSNEKIKLVVLGSRDDIAQAELVKKAMPQWNPEASLKIIEGADHFYISKTGELKAIIGEFLNNELLLTG